MQENYDLVLTNGRGWIFLILTLDDKEGGTYFQSPLTTLKTLRRSSQKMQSPHLFDYRTLGRSHRIVTKISMPMTITLRIVRVAMLLYLVHNFVPEMPYTSSLWECYSIPDMDKPPKSP